ncbi:MAG: hypothetical protein R3344_15850, partial [Acidobacteriota bacterium]|nr:hypothetical protein [Acidobacteriota bacterium]
FLVIMALALVVAVTAGRRVASSSHHTPDLPSHGLCNPTPSLSDVSPSRIPGVRISGSFESQTPVRQTWFGGKIGGANFVAAPGDGYAAQLSGGSPPTIIRDRY